MHHEQAQSAPATLPGNRLHAGMYLVTLYLQDGAPLFGNVAERALALTAAGRMAAYWWERLPVEFPGLGLDTYAVMPNHVRGLLALAAGPHVLALGQALAWYKAQTVRAYALGMQEQGWPPPYGELWQRDDYIHEVRDGNELKRIRVYILASPVAWNRPIPM